MSRLLPRSLLGQVMASVMAALLVAQLVGVFLLYQASRDRLELSALTALAAQLSIGPDRIESDRQNRPANAAQRAGWRRPPPPGFDSAPVLPAVRLPRDLRYQVRAQPAVALNAANTASERTERLRDLLVHEGLQVHRVALELRTAGMDPDLLAFARSRPRIARDRGWRNLKLYVASIQRSPGSEWETARVFEPRPPAGSSLLLVAQTALIYVFLVAVLFVVIRRITRPLAQLAERVDDFSKSPDRAVRLEETGPTDTRRLIAAHNAMEARIAALIDEKDVMLGAIGHDLKTPLAALRVRIESVPDENQRARMAASIEDITRTLDDILSLARVGRARDSRNPDEMAEAVDLKALAQSVVEEFEDLGDPVTLDMPEGRAHERAERIVAKVQVTWFKRALRNLVSNAVRYGGVARVSILRGADGAISLRVDDDGPGIEEGRIGEMLQPFTRGDASRNRATGGSGLGLTLAHAIAEAHGGELVLANREMDGEVQGLRAEIRLAG